MAYAIHLEGSKIQYIHVYSTGERLAQQLEPGDGAHLMVHETHGFLCQDYPETLPAMSRHVIEADQDAEIGSGRLFRWPYQFVTAAFFQIQIFTWAIWCTAKNDFDFPPSIKSSIKLHLIYKSGIINEMMLAYSPSAKAKEVILQDAIERDLTTARRAALLEILWHERYLTRAQLIIRVELRLGKHCFGTSAWEDTFYRDMRVVKQAFQAEDYLLAYSRDKQQRGYHLQGQPALSAEFTQMLRNSVAEVDQRQIDIYRKLSPAARFRQGCSISDTARKVVAYRIRQENPKLTVAEANRMALERAYRP